MSVYLQDGLVLLDSGLVAVDAGCCCGTCTNCSAVIFGAPCTDIHGNCWTVQNCDGTCGGEEVPCDSSWMTETQYCVDVPDCTIQTLNCISSIDPVTCEFTQIGDCGECPVGQTIITTASVRWVPCMGACCIAGLCSILTPANCLSFGGSYQGDGTDCDPDPC